MTGLIGELLSSIVRENWIGLKTALGFGVIKPLNFTAMGDGISGVGENCGVCVTVGESVMVGDNVVVGVVVTVGVSVTVGEGGKNWYATGSA